jgi:uncharacterized protein YbjT (DUF2867 family)
VSTVLVAGGTGQVGKPTVNALRAAGHDVRILSRQTGSGLTTADLMTGAGVAEALDGVDVVVHVASSNGKGDVAMSQTLFDACRAAGVAHIVLISIVGTDAIPLGFYKHRTEVERRLEASGVPYTIQRATQFHSFVDMLFSAQRFMPVLFAPAMSVQPIDVVEVAQKLAELADGPASGRAADIGGPQQLTSVELGRAWARAKGSRRRVVRVRIPGKTFAAFAAGLNLVDGPSYGHRTFASYLAAKYNS